ncbi:hypothetical protein ACFXKB_44500, partial [Streptomyces sp. NPDC059262]
MSEAVPVTHTAVSAGMMGVAHNLGNPTGVTVFGAVLAAHLLTGGHDGHPAVHAQSGFVLALLTAACAAGAALLIAAFMRGRSASVAAAMLSIAAGTAAAPPRGEPPGVRAKGHRTK